MTYICGDGGPFDDMNPSFVMRREGTTELLFLLNERPLSLDRIKSALKATQDQLSPALEDLLRIEAVKTQNGVYRVAFPIFTREDLLSIQLATQPAAVQLARNINTYADEITSLSREFSSVEQVEEPMLLFAALGCFILDWLGLKVLEEEGLLIARKPKPGNRNYLLFAREVVEPETAVKLYDRMYWGSHSDSVGDLVFTSFGDLGFRFAFPDVAWMLETLPKGTEKSPRLPSWMAEELSRLANLESKMFLKEAGILLLRLNRKEATSTRKGDFSDEAVVLGILESMGYVRNEREGFRLSYPVFVADDRKVIEQLGGIIIPLVTKIMRRNREKLQKKLIRITPMRNKVDFKEIMNELWHWTFAQTNKILAENGFLHDPPKKRVDEARYIAWVSEFAFP